MVPPAQNMKQYRPGVLSPDLTGRPEPAAAASERLETLRQRWSQFASEYAAARARNDQEVMTNLRGLMILIEREILRLGGEVPRFPAEGEYHLADL